MQFDENKDNEFENRYQGDDYAEIFSKNAILGFSIFFGSIFGGALLAYNLRAAGYRKAVWQVLLFAIAYQIFANIVASYVGLGIDPATIKAAASGVQLTMEQYKPILLVFGLTLGLNIVGGLVLSKYFFKSYFPDEDYYAKPIWGALLLSIVVQIVLVNLIKVM